jgi:hypothetical protein
MKEEQLEKNTPLYFYSFVSVKLIGPEPLLAATGQFYDGCCFK